MTVRNLSHIITFIDQTDLLNITVAEQNLTICSHHALFDVDLSLRESREEISC